MIKEEFHGSDIEAVAEKYGIKTKDIVSFSSNVNPMGISDHFKREMSLSLDCIEHYPERDYLSLRKALASYTGVSFEHIIPGNGSTELIAAFISSFQNCNALIVSPAYAEYERNTKLAGGRIKWFYLLEEEQFEFNVKGLCDSIDEDTDIVIICNPVNPVSSAMAAKDMEKVLKKAKECHAYVLVDETYIEFCDMKRYSSEGLVEEYDCLFVIRSMSKFFSCPGLRLGYAMTSGKELIERIKAAKEPWSVSSFAEKAALILLSDREHIAGSKEYIDRERERVCKSLDEMIGYGLKYFSPRANFVLCKLTEDNKKAGELFDHCIRKNLMIRDCTGYGNLDGSFFRFCFMEKENDDRLLDAIRSYLVLE